MAKRDIIRIIFIVIVFGLIQSCSTEKNTPVSRGYHNVTSHYNVYFNGNEAFKQGLLRLENSYEENYSRVLPIFIYGNEVASKMIYPDMDKAIKKGSKLIKLHSITTKPARKKGKKSKKEREFYSKNEYNDWIDESYLLMGKAHFYKLDYTSALESFEYIIMEFQDEPTKFNAYIWIARTYIEKEDFVKAREVLDLVDGDRKFPKKLTGDLEITYADYYIKQGKIDEGIPYLSSAIENIKKKKTRIRYKFILAQFYQEKEEFKKASELYSEVIKANPEYDMIFSARIRKASCFSVGSGLAENLHKELEKMLKDDKNIEYQDQIYFAMAEIAIKQGEVDEALEFYKLSSEKSVMNLNQKAVSFLAMADIYYDRPEYRNAQTYYDSTLFFIDQEFPGIDDISSKSAVLTRLIENLDIIDSEDSLQMVAGMSDKERESLIQKIIDKLIEEEKELEEELRTAQMNSALFKQNQRDPRNRNFNTGSGWYFYNPTTLSFGQSEFLKLWGRRKLEDNWRRKNKQVVEFADEFDEEFDEEGDSIAGKKRPTDPKSIEYYLVDLPINDSLLALSHEKIVDAFFSVGEIYKNELEDFDLAITNFKELNLRYPQNNYLLFTYYNLFKLYSDKKDVPEAGSYKSLIINGYPNSKYAQMFTNPNYVADMSRKMDEVVDLYNLTYSGFLKEDYQKVIAQCSDAESNYSESVLIPKFKFLKAIAYGETGSLEELVRLLNEVIQNYPESEVRQPAKEMLLMITSTEGIDLPVEIIEEKPDEPEEIIYFQNDDISHYYIVVVKNKSKKTNRMKFNISNFNMDFFSMTNYIVSSVILDENLQIISVKTMDNYKKGMEYYSTISVNPDVYSEFSSSDYQHFVISSDNFTALFNDKDVSKYLKFFNENYLNREEKK